MVEGERIARGSNSHNDSSDGDGYIRICIRTCFFRICENEARSLKWIENRRYRLETRGIGRVVKNY